LVGLAGCGAGGSTGGPEQALHKYAAALRAGDSRAAYELLSEDAKKTLPYDAFERMVRENPGEVREIAEALSRPGEPLKITAVVAAADGETLHLVYEKGSWKADVSAIDLYNQATPLLALRAFVRAFEAKRYDVLMRFVPSAKAEGLSAAKLKKAWEGEQRLEMQRLVQALRAAEATAQAEILGNRATVSYGAAGTVQLVEEDGVWKIEEF
jgi:hypothetical protein